MDVIPQTKLTTGGNITHYIENTLYATAPRCFQEYELEFSNFTVFDDNKKDEPHFDAFDWQAFGRNMVKEMVIANISPNSSFVKTTVKSIIDVTKATVDELKKTIF